MHKFDVLVLGAGAAGLLCAIEAGKRGRRVAVLERADRIGKKILISGGGRCGRYRRPFHPQNGRNAVRLRISSSIRFENRGDQARPCALRPDQQRSQPLLRLGGRFSVSDRQGQSSRFPRKNADYASRLEWSGYPANLFLLEEGAADPNRSRAGSRYRTISSRIEGAQHRHRAKGLSRDSAKAIRRTLVGKSCPRSMEQ